MSARTTKIKKWREDAIKDMISDIEESDKNGVPPDEIWETLRTDSYSNYMTESDKVKAFRLAGFTVEIG
jgi:hypothetical protein